MPVSGSISTEMQKVNAFFGETVVKGRNFAVLDHIYTIDASTRSMPASCRRAPILSKAVRTIMGFWQAKVMCMKVQDAKLVSVNAHPCRRQRR